MKSLSFLIVVILLSPVAKAQVFKCNVGGNTVYQQFPCTGDSKTVNLTNATQPSAADAAAARARLETERRKQAMNGEIEPRNRDEACVAATKKAKTGLEMKKARTLCGIPEPTVIHEGPTRGRVNPYNGRVEFW